MRIAGFLFLVASIVACGGLGSQPAQGCGAAWRGNFPSLRIADESAIIVWDAANKRQHFIRRASFETKVPYFGFLVPTPTKPELAETPDEPFKKVEDWTKPEIIVQEKWIMPYQRSIGCGAPTAKDASVAGAVDVLETKRVGDFDAAVLQASDTEALKVWLHKHGDDARPTLMEWIKPYVENKWIVTAFQIAKDDKERSNVNPAAVRMSFTTEKPFFPYSEPADLRGEKSQGSRLLRVFFIGDARVDGALANGKTTWPGKTVWADHLTEEQQKSLASTLNLPGKKPPTGAWLTVMEDAASPRPGVADLYFSPATEQNVLHRPPIIHTRYVKVGPPPELLILGGAMGLMIAGIIVGRRYARKR